MSAPTSTEELPTRWLKSPFNGELWPVPASLTVDQYDHMVHVAGFVPVDMFREVESKKEEKARARR
jgi:hypothetical protein